MTVIAGGLPPGASAVLLAVFTAVVSLIQNWLETQGTIPALLPSPGLVTGAPGAVLDTVTGTVDVVADTAGNIAGPVIDTAGKVVGGVTGTLRNVT